MNTYSKRQFNQVPQECKSFLQNWVGKNVDLEDVILHVYNGEAAVIIIAFIGYSLNVYRLFTIGPYWNISVDNSIPLEDLQEATYNSYDEDEEDWDI